MRDKNSTNAYEECGKVNTQTLKFNQVDALQNEVAKYKEIIKDQEHELLELYRTLLSRENR
jgi:hypothetical protein